MSPHDPWPALTIVVRDATHRLIPATYADTSEPYLAVLARDEGDLRDLVELTAATNDRLAAQQGRGIVSIDPYELVFEVPFSKIVNAAYSYPGPAGARFSSNRRGAWYCAYEVETSLAEVAYHRGVHLAETDWWYDEADYQDYLADVHADGFADLTDGSAAAAECLRPDDYRDSQALAARLLERGAAGVLYPAVRHEGGINLAVFRPAMVANVRPGRGYRLSWHGEPEPAVSALT